MTKTTSEAVQSAFYNKGWNDAIEAAAKECERHAKFCKDEAHRGGVFPELISRVSEAEYNAKRIRELKP